jgi:poly(3-hydroxyoctanoate) depolymerase
VIGQATTSETTVSTHGIELFVRERGDGFPLLLLNGLGGNAEMWGATEDRLSGIGRTIVLDWPGIGRSSMPAVPLTVAGLTGVVSTALGELGHDTVDVLGFSLGGLVAQQLAHERPDLVRRMALVGTACGWGSMPGTLPALTLAAMPVRYHSRALYEHTRILLSPADAKLLERHELLREARLREPPSIFTYFCQLWSAMLWTSLPWLSSVHVPTLVMSGEGDHLVPPANGVQLARLLPESRLHILEGEGHLMAFDPESATQPLLEDFFSSPDLVRSRAWTTGGSIEDDATVERAFAQSMGAQPYRALSDAYRYYIGRYALNGNGAKPAQSPDSYLNEMSSRTR